MAGVFRLICGGTLVALAAVLAVNLHGVVEAGVEAGELPEIASRLKLLEAAAADAVAQTEPSELALSVLPDVVVLAEASPLHAAPYTVAVVEALAREDLKGAVALAEIATRLDPRATTSRLVLAQALIARRDWSAALDMLSDLRRLDPDNASTYSATVSEIAAQPDAREAILAWLALPGSGGQGAAAAVIATTPDLGFAIELARPYPPLHAGIVARLIERQEWTAAYLTFLDFLSAEQLEAMTVPFDATFDGSSGARPFNWSLNGQFAEINPTGGLSVAFFGRGQPVIAEQVLVLQPGNYRLTARVRGEILEGGGQLAWRLTCIGTGELLMRLPLTVLEYTTAPREVGFVVPPGPCEFQRLTLLGVPGEYPRTLRAEFERVIIEPVEQS